MLFLKTDFNTDTTELSRSQREDCLVSILIDLDLLKSPLLFCQCFHISVKPSRLVKVFMILLATPLNELKTSLANPQKIKKQVGCFGFEQVLASSDTALL